VITLDASVWIAFIERADPFNAASDAFLSWIRDAGLAFHSPEFALIETGCALARRRRDAAFARTAVKTIAKIPNLELIPSSRIAVDLTLDEGCKHFLRGADAIYAATAKMTHTPLITWDQELIERAGGITPADWLARQA
jgi:predicted nucleic acid-binding protein